MLFVAYVPGSRARRVVTAATAGCLLTLACATAEPPRAPATPEAATPNAATPDQEAQQMMLFGLLYMRETSVHQTALAERYGIADGPPEAWLTPPYFAEPNRYPEIGRYLEGLQRFVKEAPDSLLARNEATADALGRELSIPQENLERFKRGARSGWEKRARFDVMRSLADAAVEVHEFVLSRDGTIYSESLPGDAEEVWRFEGGFLAFAHEEDAALLDELLFRFYELEDELETSPTDAEEPRRAPVDGDDRPDPRP